MICGDQLNCTACGESQGCEDAIAAGIAAIDPPIHAGFFNIQPNASTAYMSLLTNFIVLNLVCTTGQCEHAQPVQNVVGYTSYAWIIIATVATGIASCIGLTGAAFRSNRPRKVLAGMAQIDMDQSIFDDHLKESASPALAIDGDATALSPAAVSDAGAADETQFLTQDATAPSPSPPPAASPSPAPGDEKEALIPGGSGTPALAAGSSDAAPMLITATSNDLPPSTAYTPAGSVGVAGFVAPRAFATPRAKHQRVPSGDSVTTLGSVRSGMGGGARGGPVPMVHYASVGGSGPGGQPQSKDLCLVFRDVSYEIPIGRTGRCGCGPAKTRRILKPTSGIVRSGEILALMGASGAGKTTLLDILSNTQKVGKIHGSVALYMDGSRVLPLDGQFPDGVSYLSSEGKLPRLSSYLSHRLLTVVGACFVLLIWVQIR